MNGIDTMSPHIQRAFEFAAEAHRGQIDLDGMPHIFHAIRVASKQTTPERVIIGVLHDVIEDTCMQLPTIAQMFGHDIARSVKMLTRDEGMPWKRYVEDNVCTDTDAMFVKLADIQDNLQRMPPSKEKRINTYIKGYKHIADQLGLQSKLYATTCT